MQSPKRLTRKLAGWVSLDYALDGENPESEEGTRTTAMGEFGSSNII